MLDNSDISDSENPQELCAGSDPKKFWYRHKCAGCQYFSGENTIGSTPIDISYAPYPQEPRIGYSLFIERCKKYGYNRETPTDDIKKDILKRLKSRIK